MSPVVGQPFGDARVAATFDAFAQPSRSRLFELRELIFTTAAALDTVGAIDESLKWGEPSYVPAEPRTGTPIRLGAPDEHTAALYAHCQSRLIDECRARFARTLRYDGNRALLFDAGSPLPLDVLPSVLEMAFRYHRLKAGWRR